MSLLFGLLTPLQVTNEWLLKIGRALAIAALAIMVCFILGQVFFRYVLNDAPNWTEEAARFLMLWMTGLIGPMAYRQGGFVAIDMFERSLGRTVASLVGLLLLLCASVVIFYGVKLGWKNINSFTGRGTSASLRIPLELFGGENIKFKNSWAFASLFVGFCLLALVNVELILRQLIQLMGGGDRLLTLEDAGPID